ncbi:SAM-dependent methyltransferase [Apibacter muscae]|uniref:SAM-dependent methyltransferase n=1 Tax=Apibacter muscae TaxID=2509004 RepID=UPI0011AC2A15|nr:SAM-dependent methyltransferase [Apibacter muscae]TWP29985.1 SAM-dependent methyltransferase [Apibacter muscae]
MAVLYLLPAYLGENSSSEIFSQQLKNTLKEIKFFASENEKTARKFIKFICPDIDQKSLSFSILNKRTTDEEILQLTEPLEKGIDMGLISEAGLPCIADPGNKLVMWCHQNKIKVVPINGPSSILLALISSGLNGQNFSFHGYLPIENNDKKKEIIKLETLSRKDGSAHIFMETPYRNQKMFEDLLKYLSPLTMLCIATNLTLPDEAIQTLSCKQWKTVKPDIHKKPTIFIIQS